MELVEPDQRKKRKFRLENPFLVHLLVSIIMKTPVSPKNFRAVETTINNAFKSV